MSIKITPTCWRTPWGWYCTRDFGHLGPCAAKPRWWNFKHQLDTVKYFW